MLTKEQILDIIKKIEEEIPLTGTGHNSFYEMCERWQTLKEILEGY